jgi:GNAT superfamily N-acetyltransferase
LQVRKDLVQNINIRNYQSSDRETCRSLWRELTEWHRQIYQDSAIGGENPGEHFDNHLSKVGPSRIWVATIDSEVVGLIGLDVSGYENEIEPLIVTKAHRYKGVGTKLAEKAILEARKTGTSLNVSPVARNTDAIHFFYNAGFTNLGRVEMFMDFRNRKWKSPLELKGCKLNY